MAQSIFISYRQADAAAEVASLAELLRARFGPRSTFFDRDSLSAGDEWSPSIDVAVLGSKVVLVVIGPDWLKASAGEFGQRRIDMRGDVVRREVAHALRLRNKTVIPVFVRGARMPPAHALPTSICSLRKCQWIVMDELTANAQSVCSLLDAIGKHVPKARTRSATPKAGFRSVTSGQLALALGTDLMHWTCATSTGLPSAEKPRRELQRVLRFSSFQDAVRFMAGIAPHCEIMSHHPRWEHRWRDVRIGLSTWRNGYDLSNLDLEFARYIERAFEPFRVEAG